jgi:hypothetical protein
MTKMNLLISLILVSLFFISCSASNDPINPSSLAGDKPGNPTDSIASNSDIAENTSSYPGAFGAWKIHVNPEDLSAEIIPARTASAIGNIFDADLSQFLMKSPCSNCLRISSVRLNLTPPQFNNIGSTLDITFTMQHPFGNLATRPDLHGFDVRLIIIGDGVTYDYPAITVTNPDGSTEFADFADSLVINPDGFTSHFDSIVTDSRYFIDGEDMEGNLNPFFRFFEDYTDVDFDPHAPAGHNVMPVGSSTYSRTIMFNSYEAYTDLEFYAVADVAYGQSAIFANRLDPQYYLPAFNRTEAWRVEYWIENNHLDSSDPTSTADVVVQIFDWQQGATVDPSYPNPANLLGVPESSNVLQVDLNVPEYRDGLMIEITPESGTGAPSDPLTYRFTVTNENMSNSNGYGLLAVRDELWEHGAPSGRLPIPESPAGFPWATEDIRDYSMYFLVRIPYPRNVPDYGYIEGGELSVFPPSLYADDMYSMMLCYYLHDPGGKKYWYQWDYDYDGVTFDVDGSGFPFHNIDFTAPGPTTVGLRVETNSVPPHYFTYSIPVYVEGEWLNETSVTSNSNTTYFSREEAAWVTNTHCYLAYTRETAGKRDIWVSIGNKFDWAWHDTNITASQTGSFYNPAIEVIESGPNAGLYVAFSNYDSGEPDLHSIDGTLDGLTFTPENYRVISNTSLQEKDVCLFYNGTDLLAFYAKDDAVTGYDIYVSSWDFSPAGWSGAHWIQPPVNGDQDFPRVARDGFYNNIYVVWQDTQDYPTRAHDIYMATTPDGNLFASAENITTSYGLVDEVMPSLAITGRQIGVAYLQIDAVSLWPQVHLAIIDAAVGNRPIVDYPIEEGSTRYHTFPSLGTACDGHFTVAFGSYDTATDDLDAHMVEIVNQGGWTLEENVLITGDAGTIPLSAANIFPCVISRPVAAGTGIENWVAFRTFADGSTDSTLPFPIRLGEIQVVGVITEGNEYEF